MKFSTILFAITAIVGITCFTSCKVSAIAASNNIHSLVSIGDEVYEARKKLVSAGYEVGRIVDLTREKKTLSMSISLREPTIIESFGYAANVNFTPWQTQTYSHVRIKAHYSTKKIYKIETR